MKLEEILQYLRKRIPEKESGYSHKLELQVHTYHKYKCYPPLHPFVRALCEALEKIDAVIPGYAAKQIDRIAEVTDPNQNVQVYSYLSEILVMNHVIEIADVVDGMSKYTLSEPRTSKDGKNPELRSLTDGIYYAAEVKSPDLSVYKEKRQAGFQITTHLHDRELIRGESVTDPRVLTVRDFLKSTEEKYKEYTKTPEYKNDYRLLFIVWDDYVNETIAALVSPQCGLFTEHSFHKASDFSLIDGVFIIRHLHQFERVLQGQEFINGLTRAFQLTSPVVPTAFIQNPKGRQVPETIIDKFEGLKIENFPRIFAEYRPTDFVDWRNGVAFVGLDAVPAEYHPKIVEIIQTMSDEHKPRVTPDTANFGTVDLEQILVLCTNESGEVDYNSFFRDLKRTIRIANTAQDMVERKERQLQEEQNELRKRVMLQRLEQMIMEDYSLNVMSTSRNIKKEKIGRNAPCPCGSKRKYKVCCLNKNLIL